MTTCAVAGSLSFDPAAGTVIREPHGTGYGHWVGGHKVHYDATDGSFTLFYRVRTPLEQGRGGVCRVARSTDGVHFEDVWEASKAELGASSIEVGHCIAYEDEYRLYVSYERAGSSEWRIDVIRGKNPAALDTQGRRTVLSPGDYSMSWIKDPFVLFEGPELWLYAAAPPRPSSQDASAMRTVRPLDATIRAVSTDGLHFPSLEYVFEAPDTDTWDGKRARLNSLVRVGDGYAATYDGGRSFYDNYEEWAGIAVSDDGRTFTRCETDGPWVRSPHGSVRYVYGERVGPTVYMYYEYTRRDGSHDLRVATVPTPVT